MGNEEILLPCPFCGLPADICDGGFSGTYCCIRCSSGKQKKEIFQMPS
jgi:hypothetical protein